MTVFLSGLRLMLLASVAVSVLGCSGSTEPQTTSRDEVAEYLDAHPELKEPKKDVPLSDPTKP